MPTPSPAPSPTPAPTPFSVVWISDTQVYSRRMDVFLSMRDWILANREKENIVFFVHSGDVVDGASTFMFDNAAEALMPILEEIPGMIASGNHDLSNPINHLLFTCRPYAKAVQKEGQTFKDGEAAYAEFSAGGTNFLVFGIGYQVFCHGWINRVIATHPDHVELIVMHKAMQEDGRLYGQAKNVLQYVVPNAPNLRLLLCGHMRGTQLRTDWFDDDGNGQAERSFTSMMFNVQEDEESGLGFLRLLRFYPEDHRIEVSTYSPWFDQYGYPGFSEEENFFTLENAY